MSAPSDSDDSNDDFLYHQPVFAKAKPKSEKLELTPLETLERIASGKPITPKKQGKKKPTGQKRRRQPSNKMRATSKKKKSATCSKNKGSLKHKQNDPEWIEAQARKTVEEVLTLDVVEKITDFNDIGWYRYTGKGKSITYYPAIACQNKAEAKMLLKKKVNGKHKTKKIQYIGVVWRYAMAHEEIALSKWIPYSTCSELENEERLQNFLKTISKTSNFKNNPMDLKIEELAVKKMWEKVLAQKEQRQREDEKDKSELQHTASSNGLSATAAPTVHVSQDSDHNSQGLKEEDNSDSDYDYDFDDEKFPSPGKERKKRSSLHVNDEIEFYEIIGTFGNPLWLRRATVVGIRPNDSSYPLILSNATMPIPGTHRIRRLPDGFWQPINEFILVEEGIQSLVENGSGLNQTTKMMRKINTDIIKARDKFWKNEHVSSKKGRKEEDNSVDVKIGDGDGDGNVQSRRSRRSSGRIRKKVEKIHL